MESSLEENILGFQSVSWWTSVPTANLQKITISFNNTVQIIVIAPASSFSDIIAKTEEQLPTVISGIPCVQTFRFQQNYPSLACAASDPRTVILKCWNRYLY